MSLYCKLGFLVVVVLAAGCDQQAPPIEVNNEPAHSEQKTEPEAVQNEQQTSEAVPVAPEKATTPDPADEAKAYVQQLCDRLLGGDTSVNTKLLGPLGVKIASVDGIEITSVVPRFSENGVKLDDWYRIAINVQGTEAVSGQAVDQKFTLEVFRDATTKGEWTVGNVK